jgi:hypothetical protein
MPRRRRFATLAATLLISLLGLIGLAQPAAAVTYEQKLSVLSSWTQTSSTSYYSWLSARNNQGAWAAYGFTWSTDYCSNSPDNPLGFNFRLSCARHDFGYRNYKQMGLFSSAKSRLDSAFYEDMKRKCATYSSVVRPACYSLAWTYYNAVRAFGFVVVTQADLDRARALLPTGAGAPLTS